MCYKSRKKSDSTNFCDCRFKIIYKFNPVKLLFVFKSLGLCYFLHAAAPIAIEKNFSSAEAPRDDNTMGH